METPGRECQTCGQTKPLSEFYARRQPEGLFHCTSCKECMREAAKRRYQDDPEWRARKRAIVKAWNARNPDYMTEYHKTYFEKNRAAIIAKGVAWNWANRDKRVAYRRKAEYGMTQGEFDALLASQDGRCAICSVELTAKNWAIDHDHDTRAVRGLLCRGCNVMLGLAGDDHRILTKAIAYLRSRTLQIVT